MPYGTINADVIQTSTSGGILGAGNASIMKNRIINGAMVIDQRNAGASVSNTTAGNAYTLDRWGAYGTQASKYNIQQNAGSVTPPAGFTNYLGLTSSSAYSIGSSDFFWVRQAIEGFNCADLNFGSANAKTVTISFWVRSSITGTWGVSLGNSDFSRTYPTSYTINSANTWEQKTITIAGDQSGTWLTNNGAGIYLVFGLGYGSSLVGTPNVWTGSYYMPTGANSLVGTNGATLYITGVQLEVGSSATGFEYVNYQTSLANCQRYYFQYLMRYGVAGFNENTGGFLGVLAFPSMRSAPTISTSGATYQIRIAGSVVNCSSVTGDSTTQNTCRIVGNASGLTAGQGSLLIASSDTYLGLSAEL